MARRARTSDRGTTWRLGLYLKRVLKPLAASVGISDLTHQCLRRTCGTHFKGDVKDRRERPTDLHAACRSGHYTEALREDDSREPADSRRSVGQEVFGPTGDTSSNGENSMKNFLKMAPKMAPNKRQNHHKLLIRMVRPDRFELPTFWFVANMPSASP